VRSGPSVPPGLSLQGRYFINVEIVRRGYLVPTIGFELMTYRLQGDCTTTVLSRLISYPAVLAVPVSLVT
jgi:hypothetical protein